MMNGWKAVMVILIATLTAIVAGLACAGVGGVGAAGGPEGPRTPRDGEARSIYREAEAELEAADYVAAESLAQNVIVEFTETRWMPPALLLAARAAFERNRHDDARSRLERYLQLFRASNPQRSPALVLLARILHLEGDPAEAADTLLATPHELLEAEEAAFQLAGQVAAELGLQELDEITRRWPADHPLQPVFQIERASLLLAEGEPDSARAVARRALLAELRRAERERAESIVAGDLSAARWRPLFGAVLPMTGALAPYGQAVEEGIRLAVEEYNARHADSVTLAIRDDADDHRRDGRLVRELEERGALAIVGPLRTRGLEQAAGARDDDELVLVSPTAPEDLSELRNVYSMWTTMERATRGARELARFAVRELHLYRFGVVYPNNAEGRAQLEAFADEARSWGAELAASMAYDESETTFRTQLTLVAEANPQAIFAPAATPQTVIQLAPQFSFYGLRGVQVLGDDEWSAPEVLRQVEPRFVNGTIVSTFLHRSSPSVRWPEFVERYERRYRKGLGESLVPALAYDAAQLVLNSLPWGAPRRSAVARSIRETRNLPGATGVLSVEDGRVVRRTFVLEIRDRELLPASRIRAMATPAGDGGAR